MFLLHMRVIPLLGINLFQRMFAIISNYVKLSDTFNYHQPTDNIFNYHQPTYNIFNYHQPTDNIPTTYLLSNIFLVFIVAFHVYLKPLNSCNSHRFWKHYIATTGSERTISTPGLPPITPHSEGDNKCLQLIPIV